MNEKMIITDRIISNVLKMLEMFDRKTLWHYFRASVNYHETKTLQIDFFCGEQAAPEVTWSENERS